jgi:hypothetical protein
MTPEPIAVGFVSRKELLLAFEEVAGPWAALVYVLVSVVAGGLPIGPARTARVRSEG